MKPDAVETSNLEVWILERRMSHVGSVRFDFEIAMPKPSLRCRLGFQSKIHLFEIYCYLVKLIVWEKRTGELGSLPCYLGWKADLVAAYRLLEC